MKLYGAAIAGIHPKDNEDILNVICTPISVTDGDRLGFEEGPGCFESRVDLRNVKSVTDAFMDVTRLIGKLVKDQQDSCRDNGVAYRPVVLDVGQDSRQRVNPDTLYITLFNQRLYAKNHNTVLGKKAWERQEYLNFFKRRMIEPLGDHVTPERAKAGVERSLAELSNKDSWNETRKRSKIQIAQDRLNVAKAEAKLLLARAARAAFFAGNKEYHQKYKDSCAELSRLLPQCTLLWGSFHPPEKLSLDDKQSDLDLKLIALKQRWEGGNKSAHDEIIDIAKALGKDYARSAKFSHTFVMGGLTQEQKDSEVFREKFPHHFFYEWHPDFKDAFYESYRQHLMVDLKTKNYRHMKLATEPGRRPFADPCADGIAAEFARMRGLTTAQPYDFAQWRKRIASSARQVDSNLRINGALRPLCPKPNIEDYLATMAYHQ